MQMREVGPWTLCEGGVYRALIDRNGEVIANRVAFIEKTPRVRIRSASLGEFEKDHLNWASGCKGDGPEDQWSRAWCDEALELFGYRVSGPVKANWRAMCDMSTVG